MDEKNTVSESHSGHAPPAVGLTSFVLGMIGMILFFLPILGAPISGLGAVAGIVGCFLAGGTNRAHLRWAVAGVVLSFLALSVNLGLAWSPSGYQSSPSGPPNEPVPDTPYVSPPDHWRSRA
jgi:hypothetical protein